MSSRYQDVIMSHVEPVYNGHMTGCYIIEGHMTSVIHITIKSTAAKPTGKSHDIRVVVM